jgi:hypothetical protein
METSEADEEMLANAEPSTSESSAMELAQSEDLSGAFFLSFIKKSSRWFCMILIFFVLKQVKQLSLMEDQVNA